MSWKPAHTGWLLAILLVVGLAALVWRVASLHDAGRADQAPVTPASREPRGKILSSDGEILAASRRAVSLYVTPSRLDRSARKRLIRALGLRRPAAEELTERLRRGADRAGEIRLLDDIGLERATRIARIRAFRGAVAVRDEWSRDYRLGATFAHVVGHVAPTRARSVGVRGVEASFDRTLEGGRDRDAAGRDVVLTVNASLQQAAADAVADAGAAGVVVVEVNTGRILALVSTPSFDPNIMSSELASVERERLERDPRRPLDDRAVERAYPPASTYKLVTALAALEAHEAPLDEKVTCRGHRVEPERTLQDMGVHGAVDLLDAIRVSCNVYFWTIAERVGLHRMHDVARELGYGARTGVELEREATGSVPDVGGPDRRSRMPLLQAAIGSGDVEATVLQVALAYAALANGGSLYAPQLVRQIRTADGKVVEEPRPVLRRRLAFAATNLDVVRRGMRQVVNEKGGTGYAIHEGAVPIAGKTGTAPIRERSTARPLPGWDPDVYHAWFAGWAPADRPVIAIAVMVEHGGIGGEVAAPIARRIVDSYFVARQAAANP